MHVNVCMRLAICMNNSSGIPHYLSHTALVYSVLAVELAPFWVELEVASDISEAKNSAPIWLPHWPS